MTGKATYEVGKGKPPKHTQFKPGNNANPTGKTPARAAMERDNAQMALEAKNRYLRALLATQAEQSTEELLASFTPSDILKLMKDAEDRAHGTPKQSIDLDAKVEGDIVMTFKFE